MMGEKDKSIHTILHTIAHKALHKAHHCTQGIADAKRKAAQSIAHTMRQYHNIAHTVVLHKGHISCTTCNKLYTTYGTRSCLWHAAEYRIALLRLL